jgi:hypothetical protein
MWGILKGTMIFAACVVALYVLPNLVENYLMGHLNPWVGCVIWGDAVGCFVLYRVFGMRQLAVLLYLAMAEINAVLLATHAVSLNQLMWITDLVPALTAGALGVFAQVYFADRNSDRELVS